VDFQFDEVQQSIRQMVKAFVDREVRPVAMAYELEDRYPAPIVEQMRELGFFGFTIPEQYGGSGLDEVCYAILMEELSVGWMSLAGILGTHMMTAWMILHYGTGEQRDAYLPNMATGAWMKSTCERATMYTPAATMVAAWISALTGVGPSMASGSQT